MTAAAAAMAAVLQGRSNKQMFHQKVDIWYIFEWFCLNFWFVFYFAGCSPQLTGIDVFDGADEM